MPDQPLARVILIGGASGSGKSRLAEHSGLPLLRLDDFYREGDDPELPRLASGEVDWDDARSWHLDRAVAALERLAYEGETEVPAYDIGSSSITGSRTLALDGHRCFVAEGIFVADAIEAIRERGLLDDALCVRRSRWITMGLRFLRDVREARKPIPTLLRRGLRLARREPGIVRALAERGFRPMSVRRIRALLAARASLAHHLEHGAA